MRTTASIVTSSLLAVALASATPAHAQGGGVSLRATVDRTEITLSDRIALQLTVMGAQDGIPRLPDLPDFDVRQGGTSSQFQIVNGRTSAALSFTYFLLPKRQGTFVIPPATVEVGGVEVKSQPITVKVVAEAAQPERERDLFVTALVSNPKPYVGEQIVYTWRLLHRVRLTDARLEPFSFAGFQLEDLGDTREYETTVGGQLYRVHEIKKALFPQQAGTLSLTGPALECAVVVQRQGGLSTLDQMLGRFDSQVRRVKSPAVTVEVRALPPAPSGFGGLVGQFKIDSTLSRAELGTGQSTTLKITVAGTGNARLISEPRLAGLESFKLYDEKPQQFIERSGDEIRGRKIFTKSLVPLQAGTLTLPGATLVYFDPQAERFQTATSPPLTLVVSQTPGQEDSRLTEALAPGGGKVNVTILADDILPIDRDLEAARVGGPWPAGWMGFVALFLLPPLSWFALFWRQRRELRFSTDRGLRRRLEALKKAQPLARQAAQSWTAGARGEAAALASKALRQYIGDKVGVEGGALTTDEAAAHLTARGVSAERVGRVRQVLLDLEAMQYGAGGAGAQDGRELETLLTELEGELATREKGRAVAAAIALLLGFGGAGLTNAQTLAPAAAAGPPEEVLVRANNAYEEGDYAQAVELYRSLVARAPGSGALHYNLGNAYLRRGELGRAVAAYRQAGALTPRSSDLAANLAFARQAAKDALPPPEPSKLASTLFFWHYRLSRRELATVLLITNALFWLVLGLRQLRLRSEALTWLAGASLVVAAASGASLAVRTIAPQRIAVILPAEVEVKSSTDPKALTRFKLHAGSEVELEGRTGGWLRIHLPDGEPGWIPDTEAQIVDL